MGRGTETDKYPRAGQYRGKPAIELDDDALIVMNKSYEVLVIGVVGNQKVEEDYELRRGHSSKGPYRGNHRSHNRGKGHEALNRNGR